MSAGHPSKSQLTKKEALCLIEIIQQCLICPNEKAFREIIDSLKRILPFDFFTGLIARVEKNTIANPCNIISGYPDEWMDIYMEKQFYHVDPVIITNFSMFSLQSWDEIYRKTPPPADFSALSADFRLTRGYTHGICCPSGGQGSLFSFAGAIEYNGRAEEILRIIVPAFHNAIERLARLTTLRKVHLTAREKEVLKWIKEGKSTWDISMILQISFDTVNFHVKNIFEKLDVRTRPQAVATALGYGLIDFD